MELEFARNFFDLVVYQKARSLQSQVLDLSRKFPDSERYGLTDQIRRASRSIGGQVSEGWGKRFYPRHFVSKLTDAIGEALETQHWLITAVDASYSTREAAIPLFEMCSDITRMLGKMIQRNKDFCLPPPSMLREELDEFFAISSVDPFVPVNPSLLARTTTY